MNELIRIDLVDGKPAVTSLQVAEAFGKEHFHVIRDIEQIISQLPENSIKTNFGLIETPVKVGFGIRNDKMYLLTRDGFTLLVMGYTGESNFGLSSYLSEQNKELPLYVMSRDGFTILVATPGMEAARAWALRWRSFYGRSTVVQRSFCVRSTTVGLAPHFRSRKPFLSLAGKSAFETVKIRCS